MSESLAAAFAGNGFSHSNVLERMCSRIAGETYAVVDFGQRSLGVTSSGAFGAGSNLGKRVPGLNDPGEVIAIDALEVSSDALSALTRIGRPREARSGIDTWAAFNCRFESGACDRIVFRNPGELCKKAGFERDYLNAVWPILRRDCAAEVASADVREVDDALLWTIAQRVNLAVMVYNASGMMLRMNLAARGLLESGDILRRSPAGIIGTTEADTKSFRTALVECAEFGSAMEEKTILLTRSNSDQPVPATLSRFFHGRRATRLVVAVLPQPPDPEDIEKIARSQGLSGAEARVATLMQLGLTNKVAAARAGLKEETFNTYAKRALNKLNVDGRTEMAQLLTWQSAGRLLQ